MQPAPPTSSFFFPAKDRGFTVLVQPRAVDDAGCIVQLVFCESALRAIFTHEPFIRVNHVQRVTSRTGESSETRLLLYFYEKNTRNVIVSCLRTTRRYPPIRIRVCDERSGAGGAVSFLFSDDGETDGKSTSVVRRDCVRFSTTARGRALTRSLAQVGMSTCGEVGTHRRGRRDLHSLALSLSFTLSRSTRI